MSKHLDHISADYIRYANCWEDADVLCAGLSLQKNTKILSVSSAGDNTLSLLTANPELVVAADLNSAQLNLLRLKVAAISALNREEYIAFSGFVPGIKRVDTYLKIRSNLNQEARGFWDSRASEINMGIVFCGKFERYFAFFHHKILPLIHQRKTTDKLFASKTESEQMTFYINTWSNWRWRLLFKLFFSKTIMGRFGRDPAFLKEVKVPVSEFIYEKTEHHLSSIKCQDNYFLSHILRGKFGATLPHYVRPVNYEIIKENLTQLSIEKNYVQKAGEKYGLFDHFNLSNIFEYMNPQVFKETAHDLAKLSKSGATLAYWNLMVQRKLHEALPESFSFDRARSAELSKMDKGFFYGDFNLINRIS